MSGKVKMRCARCGKSFKSSGSKQILCADCEAKVRQERAAKPAARPAASTAPAPAPKIVGPGAAILGATPTPLATPPHPFTPGQRPPTRPDRHAPAARPSHAGQSSPLHPSQSGAPAAKPTVPRHPAGEAATHTPRAQAPKPPREPKPPQQPKREAKREPKREPQPQLVLTDELRQRIEARYLELADPVEFDGIRSRIAEELGTPKSLVKRAVLEYRQRSQLPSWWELQAYKGGAEDLARIRSAYMSHLPVPPIGIHKQLATDLGLEPLTVYQGIRRVRAELRLPQYNPPEAHETPGEPATVAGNGAGADSADAS